MRWSKGGAPDPKKAAKPAVFSDRTPVSSQTPQWLERKKPPLKAKNRISLRPPSMAPPPRASEHPKALHVPPAPHPVVIEEHAHAPMHVAPAIVAPEPVIGDEPSAPPQEAVDEGVAEGLAALRTALVDLASLRDVLSSQTEQQLVELAVTIAQKVIGRELATDPQIVVNLAREGLRALDARDRIIVHVGEGMGAEAIAEFTDALRRDAPRCEVVTDPSLGPYDCSVETELGRVDEAIETRLGNVLDALFDPGRTGAR